MAQTGTSFAIHKTAPEVKTVRTYARPPEYLPGRDWGIQGRAGNPERYGTHWFKGSGSQTLKDGGRRAYGSATNSKFGFLGPWNRRGRGRSGTRMFPFHGAQKGLSEERAGLKAPRSEAARRRE